MEETLFPKTLSKNKIFCDIWNSPDAFVLDYKSSGLAKETISDDRLAQIFLLVYARHGNDPIASNDVNIFKYKFYSIIFTKGGKWCVSVTKQDELEAIEDDDLTIASKSTVNFSENPTTTANGGTSDDSGLETINNQNVQIARMNKMVAYNTLISTLKDVTSDFIKNFDALFNPIVFDNSVTFYETQMED